jgi:hypothetical protein
VDFVPSLLTGLVRFRHTGVIPFSQYRGFVMIGSNGVVLVLLGSVFLLLAFTLLWAVLMLLSAMQRNRLFEHEGVVAIGEVVAHQVDRKLHGVIVYRFIAETSAGRSVQVMAREEVWPALEEALAIGTRVFVEYVPRNPEIARLSPVCRTVPQMLA